MGNLKFSVIIPVYNSEKTIERCLNSLVKQNRKDVEIIIVNDGSTDASKIVITEFINNCKTDSEIVYIEQPNSGVSKARNLGLSIAKGEYITFVDSDDYVSDEYFETLDLMGNDDLSVFGICSSDATDGVDAQLQNIAEKASADSDKLELLISSRKIMPTWNKIYKRDIINKNSLKFIENFKIGEDFDFCLAYALKSNSISIISKAIYYVDISDTNSLSRKYRPELEKQMSEVFKHIEKITLMSSGSVKNINQILTILDYLFIKNTFSCIAEDFKYKKPHYIRDKEKFAKICEVFQYCLIKEKKYCNIVHRSLRFLLRHNFVFPFYIVAYLVKWRKFKKYLRKDEK